MKFSIDDATRKRARTPHELAMVNLLVANLLLCGGILANTLARKGSLLEHYKIWLIVVPLALSLTLITYSFRRAKKALTEDPWFSAVHWQITTRHYRFLMLAYLVGAALIGLGWLLSLTNPKLHDLMFVALVRVAVAPMLISIMVLAVLESSALFQAGSGEVPDAFTRRFPPPAAQPENSASASA